MATATIQLAQHLFTDYVISTYLQWILLYMLLLFLLFVSQTATEYRPSFRYSGIGD
jgi:hypothetical protein